MQHDNSGDPLDNAARFLRDLGWSAFFSDQITPDDAGFAPMRIATVHRSRMSAMSSLGPVKLELQVHTNTGEFAVGDWVLVDPQTRALQRRLTRRTVLERRTDASPVPQLAGANLDTLFIVTSCNADFHVPRLERYVALANAAQITPVIVLTKSDLAEDVQPYREQALAIQRDLQVVVLKARAQDALQDLAPWCGPGQTVALIGSSGVGKSTTVNMLAGSSIAAPQLTGAIREHDAQGRHTTTARSLHAIAGGGYVIDSPGIRTLYVSNAGEGIGTLFAEITELVPLCKFRDCTHAHEPGCAVREAVQGGRLDPERLERWRMMSAENVINSPVAPRPGASKADAARQASGKSAGKSGGGKPAPKRRPRFDEEDDY